jgi:MarR family transcriptional regulator, transcriptional regulator for hemolysin
VRRDEDPEDRRAQTITLTDEGRAVTARMEERLVTLRARLLKGVTREDLETTLRVLHAFSATLDVKPLAELEALIEGGTKATKISKARAKSS